MRAFSPWRRRLQLTPFGASMTLRVALHLDRARLFRWHLELIDRLNAAGVEARAAFCSVAEPLPVTLTALLDFDRVRARSGGDRFSVRMSPAAFEPNLAPPNFAADLTVDVSTSTRLRRLAGRVLRPLYDGAAHDLMLYQALLAGRAPRLDVADTNGGTWSIGLPALERPHHFATSLDETTSRLVEGLLTTVRLIEGGARCAPSDFDQDDRTPTQPRSKSQGSLLSSIGAFTAARAGRKTQRARDRLASNQPKWHVAWRVITGDSYPKPGLAALSDYQVLHDDGRRVFADPFVLERDGVRHILSRSCRMRPASASSRTVRYPEMGAPAPSRQSWRRGRIFPTRSCSSATAKSG